VAWSDLPVPPLTVVSEPELAKWVRSCRANGDLQVALNLAAAAPGGTGASVPGVRVTGRIGISDFSVEDPAAAEVALAWKSFEGVIEELFLPIGVPSAETRVHLASLRLEEPSVRYTMPTTAFDAFAAEPAQEAGGAPQRAADEGEVVLPVSEDESPAPGPVDVRLGSFELRGGQLAFQDRSVSPPFRSEVKRLRVALRDVHWPDVAVGSFDVTARLPRQGRLAVKGSLSALDTGTVELALQRLALPPFNPYASSAAGYRVDRGEASLQSALRLRGQRYEAKNDLVLHRLTVDPDSEADFEGQFGMSIDLALALLRDRKGDIGLPIPVAFEGSEVEVGIGSIVRSALTSAMRGALLSPLRGIGAVLPGGGKGDLRVEPLLAVAGRPELAPGQEERLAGLAGTLSSHGALALVLRGRAGKADRPFLAEAVLLERASAGEPLPELESAGWSDRRRMSGLLEARKESEVVEMDAEDAALWARYLEATTVPAERFEALAKRRAELAAEALRQNEELDPAQIQIETADSRGRPAVVLELAPLEVEVEDDPDVPAG
jgi:hypothetical protein